MACAAECGSAWRGGIALRPGTGLVPGLTKRAAKRGPGVCCLVEGPGNARVVCGGTGRGVNREGFSSGWNQASGMSALARSRVSRLMMTMRS